MTNFDIKKFKNLDANELQYDRQINRLEDSGFNVGNIKKTVTESSDKIKDGIKKPFVIYGEPQSGKTEMMICLTAKLLDDGFKFIIILLNDSVDLLGQNLDRFQTSNLIPTPKNFTQILDSDYDIKTGSHVIFCKKNAKNLDKLIQKLDGIDEIVIIDDEADYASPNGKINKEQQTKINELIEKLKKSDGLYIGVTATPARLDLNNTFGNVSTEWVEFCPPVEYTGQNVFFPIDGKSPRYSLKLLKDTEGDTERHIRIAFFRYLVAVAYLNRTEKKKNYSMLVHTSRDTDDHTKDRKIIQKIIGALSTETHPKFKMYIKEIWDVAKDRYPNSNADELVQFIIRHNGSYDLIVLNFKRDVYSWGADASEPKSTFTIVIGGNVVSRGMTFNNLLSMYFTRDVKHKIQQDTYIQRARMFGFRKKYLKHFELTIPENLYKDWHRCFVYHKLSLDGARAGNPPIWYVDRRVAAVASPSIDNTTVSGDLKKGTVPFDLFQYDDEKIAGIIPDIENGEIVTLKELRALHDYVAERSLPEHLLNFIENFDGGGTQIAFYPSSPVDGYKEDASSGDNITQIYRAKGFWRGLDRDLKKRFSHLKQATHHFKIFYHSNGNARVFYRNQSDDISSLRFLKNIKHS